VGGGGFYENHFSDTFIRRVLRESFQRYFYSGYSGSLTPKAEKCSNLTTDSSRYSKNFLFYPFIFLSRTVKKLSHYMCFLFFNISDSARV
jgi:hypothetical protein